MQWGKKTGAAGWEKFSNRVRGRQKGSKTKNQGGQEKKEFVKKNWPAGRKLGPYRRV